MALDKNSTYTFDELWDAVEILNPNYIGVRNSDRSVLVMIIPNIISEKIAEQMYSDAAVSIQDDQAKTFAINLLTLAYYHLCHGGVYHLTGEYNGS